MSGTYSYLFYAYNSDTNEVLENYNGIEITGNVISVSVTGLADNQEYYWKVKQKYTGIFSTILSEFSEAVYVTTPNLLPPQNVTGTIATASGFTLSFTPASGATSLLYLSTNNFNTFVNGYNGITVTGTSLTISDLSPAVSYQYGMKSQYNNLLTEYSTTGSITTLGLIQIPDTPINLTVSNISNDSATFTWDSSDSADTYNLYILNTDTNLYLDENGSTFASPTPYKNTALLTLTATNLSDGANYEAYISAENIAGESALSGAETFKTTSFRIFYKNSDGTRVYIYHNNETFTDEVKLNAQTSYAEFDLNLSKDNKKVIYNRDIYSNGNYQIFIYDFETQVETQLTANSSINYNRVALNSDGSECFYSIANSDIYKNTTTGTTANFASTQVKLNSSATDATSVSFLDYDSTNNKIIYSSLNVVASVNYAGSAPVRFLPNPERTFASRHPCINQANDKVTFNWYGTTLISGGSYFNLSTSNIDGTSPVRHTAYTQTTNSSNTTLGNSAQFRPVWDSTDNRIYFYLYNATLANRELRRIDSDGNNNTQIITGGSFNFTTSFALLKSGYVNV